MNWFSYRKSLIKLQRLRRKEEKAFHRKLAEAEKTGNVELISKTRQTESFSLQMTDEEIAVLMTKRLQHIANKLLLALPQKPLTGGIVRSSAEEVWRLGNYYGEWYLTTKGIMDVRKLIRQDRKERLDLILPWFVLTVGLIGSLTGLFAVIKKLQ